MNLLPEVLTYNTTSAACGTVSQSINQSFNHSITQSTNQLGYVDVIQVLLAAGAARLPRTRLQSEFVGLRCAVSTACCYHLQYYNRRFWASQSMSGIRSSVAHSPATPPCTGSASTWKFLALSCLNGLHRQASPFPPFPCRMGCAAEWRAPGLSPSIGGAGIWIYSLEPCVVIDFGTVCH